MVRPGGEWASPSGRSRHGRQMARGAPILNRRCPDAKPFRGAPRIARQGRRRAFGLDYRETQRGLVGREQARSVRQALRLLRADGIHVQARLEDEAQCLLVIIGATPEGKKELVGLIDGVRESAQSWRELLLDLKRRGLAIAPELAVADGALGFWQAIEEVWPKTRGQRCWVHYAALRIMPISAAKPAWKALIAVKNAA